MSMTVGTKVRVSRDASYRVKRACKAAKKTYLLGVIRTPKDPCCGCYIVEFNRNIGTDSTFGGRGKMGYCDEVQPEFITVVGKAKVEEPTSEYRDPKVGDLVVYHGGIHGPAKEGAVGIIRIVDGSDSVGVEFIRGYRKEQGHDLDGSVKNGAGWWLSTRKLTLAEGDGVTFKVGDKVEIIERHDHAQVGMKGTVVVVNKDQASHPFGIQFPGWDGGHNLHGRLEGVDRLQGQWVPATSLKLRGVGEPLPSTLISKPALKKDVQVYGGYRVRILKDMKTAIGGNPLKAGSTWSADKVEGIYGYTYYLIPFGSHNTILAFESDVEVL